MANLEFDDEGSRLVEEFNASAGATARRARIIQALALKPGDRVLDVGSGPGHQAFDLSSIVGTTGRIDGVDPAESAIGISERRCSELGNVNFQFGEASKLPFDDATFDAVMSSQVFEYLDDVAGGLAQMFRVLKSGGRVLVHDTDWGAVLWHSSDAGRMARIMEVFEGHLMDPHLPQSLGRRLADAGFKNVRAETIVQAETDYDPGSVSAILMKFVVGYVVSQGVFQGEVDAWADDLRALGSSGDYFFSSNEYIFTADKQ
jgi:ubiquinone/menaquinone biosynthesis C-methylase UbiE